MLEKICFLGKLVKRQSCKPLTLDLLYGTGKNTTRMARNAKCALADNLMPKCSENGSTRTHYFNYASVGSVLASLASCKQVPYSTFRY